MTGQAITQQPATESGSDLAITERLVTSTIGTLELFSVHLGRALKLYGILAQGR